MKQSRLVLAVLTLALLGPLANAAATQEGTLIVLNKSEATASLIDLASGEVAATVPTGRGPHEVAVSPDGRLAVACNYGGREAAGNTLTVIDVPHARVVKTIDLGEYRRPHGIRWLSDGHRIVVTAEDDKALLTVDIQEAKVLGTAETGQEISHMVAVTPDDKRAFVANIGSGSVSVIDLASGGRLSNPSTGEGAEGIDITPDGKEVWVTNRAADTITILDSASLEILATLPSASFPIRVKITPDGRHALVSNAKSAEVVVFDTSTRKSVHRIPMDLKSLDADGRLFAGRFGESSVPIGILIHPDGKRAYVANANADVVSILDLEEWKLIGGLIAGKEPDGLGYSELAVEAVSRK